jgi:hypothetical protein
VDKSFTSPEPTRRYIPHTPPGPPPSQGQLMLLTSESKTDGYMLVKVSDLGEVPSEKLKSPKTVIRYVCFTAVVCQEGSCIL